jgi:hypothetical protein
MSAARQANKVLHIFYADSDETMQIFAAIGCEPSLLRIAQLETCLQGFHRPSQNQDASLLAVSHHAVVEADFSNAPVRKPRLLVPVRGMAALLGVLADASLEAVSCELPSGQVIGSHLSAIAFLAPTPLA